MALALPTDARAVDAMVPVPYRVVGRARETADTITLSLEPVGPPIATPAPGQFNMLYAFGVGEVPISVSGIDAGQRVRHTVRGVGAVSQELCAAEAGAMVGVRGPFGTDWGVEAAAGGDVIVIAGGIGLAPLRPVIHELLRNRRRFRRVTVLVGARSPEEIVFRGEVASWQASARITVRTTVDYATAAWKGEVGLVPTLIEHITIDPELTTVMICGPEVMMRFTAAEVLGRGVAAERVRVSMERNMQCGVGRCGHCQLGPVLICHHGPVFPWSRVGPLLARREL
jgi:anaerobic sulfite reductase subunit B